MKELLANAFIKGARHIYLTRVYAASNDIDDFCDSTAHTTSCIGSDINIFTVLCIVFFHVENAIPNFIGML